MVNVTCPTKIGKNVKNVATRPASLQEWIQISFWQRSRKKPGKQGCFTSENFISWGNEKLQATLGIWKPDILVRFSNGTTWQQNVWFGMFSVFNFPVCKFPVFRSPLYQDQTMDWIEVKDIALRINKTKHSGDLHTRIGNTRSIRILDFKWSSLTPRILGSIVQF